MSVNEKRITVFLKDGSQEKIVIESGTEKLKERERLNKMTEEEIDQAARSDPDALPVEDEEIWKQGRQVDPEPLPELVTYQETNLTQFICSLASPYSPSL